jgi:hypothetical protein
MAVDKVQAEFNTYWGVRARFRTAMGLSEGWMNESGRRIFGPAARVMHTPQHVGQYRRLPAKASALRRRWLRDQSRSRLHQEEERNAPSTSIRSTISPVIIDLP